MIYTYTNIPSSFTRAVADDFNRSFIESNVPLLGDG